MVYFGDYLVLIWSFGGVFIFPVLWVMEYGIIYFDNQSVMIWLFGGVFILPLFVNHEILCISSHIPHLLRSIHTKHLD